MPGWKVQAFRARGPLTSEIGVGGLKLGYEDVWCGVVERAEDGIRLVLCIRGLTQDTDQMLSQAAVLMLDNAVGEYDSEEFKKVFGRIIEDIAEEQINTRALNSNEDIEKYLGKIAKGKAKPLELDQL